MAKTTCPQSLNYGPRSLLSLSLVLAGLASISCGSELNGVPPGATSNPPGVVPPRGVPTPQTPPAVTPPEATPPPAAIPPAPTPQQPPPPAVYPPPPAVAPPVAQPPVAQPPVAPPPVAPPPVRPPPPVGEKRVVLVVGDLEVLGQGDEELLDILDSMDFLTIIAQDDERRRDFDDYGLVVISSSAAVQNVGDEWSLSEAPVLVMDNTLFPEMSMTEDRANDAGTQNARDIEISREFENHPLAAGLAGDIEVARINSQLNFGTPGPDADIIATFRNGGRQRAAIFVYEAGARLADDNNNRNRNTGLTARNRRVGFFANEAITDNLSSEGELLLEAALEYTYSGRAIIPQ